MNMATILNVELNFSKHGKLLNKLNIQLDQDQLDEVIKKNGLKAGNDSLDGWFKKFSVQFKEKLAEALKSGN